MVDEKYCNENKDYDIRGRADDWDALDTCCKDAREASIADSDCASPLPPRPAEDEKAAANPNNESTTNDDYCDPGDYDFSKPRDKETWSQCCKDADMAHVEDKDCDKIKF